MDNKIIEIEEGDAKLLQFSEQRDRLILDKYTMYVHKFSAKEALNIFAEDYELLDIPTGLKSTTAKQYTNRILEFLSSWLVYITTSTLIGCWTSGVT